MINPYKLNKIARHLQHTIRHNVIEHYNWAYDFVSRGRFRSERIRQKMLDELDKCLTPGRHRNNINIIRSPSVPRVYDNQRQTLKHVLTFRVPSVKFLEDEIRAMQEDFGELAYDFEGRKISAVLGPFEVEGVQFGRFKVELSTITLGKVFPDYRPYVQALDPNYPPHDYDGGHPHPHVRRNTICIGRGEQAFEKSVSEARVLDSFTIINSVLDTYGIEPYMPIDAWLGNRCPDCSRFFSLDNGEGGMCYSCEENYCEQCSGICCEVGEYMCIVCRREEEYICTRCEIAGCASCNRECAGCGQRYCTNHIEGNIHGCPQTSIW